MAANPNTPPEACSRSISIERSAGWTCEVCGNDYDKSIQVEAAGERHTFDSFECAVHMMAPVCEHCGCRVIGHGTEVRGRFYCCAHCARVADGSASVKDRA